MPGYQFTADLQALITEARRIGWHETPEFTEQLRAVTLTYTPCLPFFFGGLTDDQTTALEGLALIYMFNARMAVYRAALHVAYSRGGAGEQARTITDAYYEALAGRRSRSNPDISDSYYDGRDFHCYTEARDRSREHFLGADLATFLKSPDRLAIHLAIIHLGLLSRRGLKLDEFCRLDRTGLQHQARVERVVDASPRADDDGRPRGGSGETDLASQASRRLGIAPAASSEPAGSAESPAAALVAGAALAGPSRQRRVQSDAALSSRAKALAEEELVAAVD